MTKLEGAIISAYTGNLCSSFDSFHKYAEEKLGRPVFTHEFADRETMDKLKEASKEDFTKLMESQS